MTILLIGNFLFSFPTFCSFFTDSLCVQFQRVLFGYQGESNVVDLVGVGEGGIEALKSQLQPESINYGLVRVYDFYDGHRTTKFVLILWVGERVKIMRKARITTHKGALVEFIGQHHTDISCANLGEINEEIIMTAVKNASGTAVHVK